MIKVFFFHFLFSNIPVQKYFRNLFIHIKIFSHNKIFKCKTFSLQHVNESLKSYLGNNEQKTIFPDVSRLDAHFGFALPFLACPIGRASETERPKKRARRNKFVQACNRPTCCMSISNRNINTDKLNLKEIIDLLPRNTKY